MGVLGGCVVWSVVDVSLFPGVVCGLAGRQLKGGVPLWSSDRIVVICVITG